MGQSLMIQSVRRFSNGPLSDDRVCFMPFSNGQCLMIQSVLGHSQMVQSLMIQYVRSFSNGPVSDDLACVRQFSNEPTSDDPVR